MKRTVILATSFLALAAAPTFAEDLTPAERFGLQNGGSSGSAATLDMAVSKLSGDDLEDRILQNDAEVATRNVTLGDQQLAAAMGVDVNQYTTAELAAMYIGKYD